MAPVGEDSPFDMEIDMPTTRREFVKTAAAGAAIGFAACGRTGPPQERDLSAAKKEFAVAPPIEERKYPPLADDAFRLPKSWHDGQMRRVQEYLKAERLAGALLDSASHQAYFTGLYMSRTERPAMAWIPAEGPPHFFVPGLDRDLVDTWGIAQSTYFDFKNSGTEVLATLPHVYGSGETILPRHGPTRDLFEWMLEGVKKLGVDGSRVAIDSSSFDPREDASPRQQVFAKVFPGKQLVGIGATLSEWRLPKDEYEIALVQKALDIGTEIAIHCRAYIIEHGTDLTDFAVRQEGQRFGTELVMHTLGLATQLEDGMPHTAVEFSAGVGCRAGMNTAWPHPNQFHYRRLARGQAVQLSGSCNLAGYGGEGYRACHIQPMDDFARKLWEVHTEMTIFQGEETKAGAIAGVVGEKTLEIPIKAGLERYIYHRPAHGWKHTPPWLSPGDPTVITENMMFSNEPGLYAPEHGVGYNHSNNILAKPDRGVRMNKTPLNKEFCWIEL